MGTHQELTTDQVEILDIIKCLESYEDEMFSNMEMKVQAFAWDCIEMEESYVMENIELMQHYQYVNKDFSISNDGKQYLLLVKEYLHFRKNPKNRKKIVFNFTLIDTVKLGAFFEATANLDGLFELVEKGVKKIIRMIKK